MEPVNLPLLNQQLTHYKYLPLQQNIEHVLHAIIPDSSEESKLLKARRILGEATNRQSDEELQIFITELQCFIDSWLDIYEKQVFAGLTLKQLLREG